MAKQEIKLTGKIEIQLGPNQLEAFLVINKELDADKIWSFQDVVNLVQQAGVTAFKMDELTKILAAAESSRDKLIRQTIATGIAAKAPIPEEFQMEAIPVPEEWKDAVSQTLAHAPDPEIFRMVQQKVEKEKTIVKKGPLPFLGNKEEVVKVVEKESIRESIAVDPIALSFGFAKADAKVGLVFPGKAGAPGKDLRGQMVPPPSLDDLVFHIGNGLAKKGNEVTATRSGIVRKGKNWVDLVPFSGHEWELVQSDDKATCFINFVPGSALLPPPASSEIIAQAVALGYKPEELISPETLDAELADAVASGKPIEHKSLSESQDAFWDILVSDDKLKAVLNAAKGTGHGKPLVMKELGKALTDSKVAFNKDRIRKDMLDWFNSSEKVIIGYVLHEGKAPANPPPQSISFSVSFLEKKEADPLIARIKEKGLPVDHTDSFPREAITGLALVKKDQRPINLGPLGAGAPGIDVYGQAIPPPPPQSVSIKLYGEIELVGTTIIQSKVDGLLVCAVVNGQHYAAVFPHCDAELNIEPADRNMTAWLSGFGHKGLGKPISRDAAMESIKKAGILKGIRQDVLDTVLPALESGHDVSRIMIAEGLAPVSPGKSSLSWLIQTASGKALTMNADGTVNFKNQDRITSLKKGTPIAKIIPPSINGTPGFDVCGKEIPVPAATESDIQIGPGLKKETGTDGTSVIVAELDGELKIDKGVYSINPFLNIKGNVDTGTGNIKFPGTVQVSGDVMTGFAVLSGNEIKVGGSIEAALLSADGDILVQGGVKGGGKALLRTKKNILASFLELCTVMVVGELKVKKAILRSRVKCNATITMPDDGSIIGGEIKVKGGLVTGNLGNQNNVPTRIFFGQDILVEDQIAVEEKEVKKIQDELGKINTAMKSPDKINDKQKLQELFNQKFLLMKQLEKSNLRLFTLKERFEQHYESKIVVKNTLFPGVILESHGRTHEVTKPSKSVMITFDTSSGRIVECPLGTKSD